MNNTLSGRKQLTMICIWYILIHLKQWLSHDMLRRGWHAVTHTQVHTITQWPINHFRTYQIITHTIYITFKAPSHQGFSWWQYFDMFCKNQKFSYLQGSHVRMCVLGGILLHLRYVEIHFIWISFKFPMFLIWSCLFHFYCSCQFGLYSVVL